MKVMILNRAARKASLVFERGPEEAKEQTCRGRALPAESGKCRALRQSAPSAPSVPEKRQRPEGWSSGREHRLPREKVHEVTWVRWRGTLKLLW